MTIGPAATIRLPAGQGPGVCRAKALRRDATLAVGVATSPAAKQRPCSTPFAGERDKTWSGACRAARRHRHTDRQQPPSGRPCRHGRAVLFRRRSGRSSASELAARSPRRIWR